MSNYNAKEKLETNIKALRTVLTWDGLDPLPEQDLKTVESYAGFGALKAILYKTEEDWAGASEADKKLRPLFDGLYDLLETHLTAKEYKRVLDSLRNSVLSAFYTPTVVPDTFYQVLSRYANVESIYDPCAGSGVFIKSAIEHLPNLKKIQSYEKDLLTAKVLQVIMSHKGHELARMQVSPIPFEQSSDFENGQYDLICSNIPFGAVPVYDEKITDRNLTGKLHNYFFAKGIEKIKEGGILAYLTTDAFLNSPSNKSARRYLFERCDFISLVVMPDNLYKETAGTEAPSHFLVVRKNTGKQQLSGEEEELVHSDYTEVVGGKVPENAYIHTNRADITIGETKSGKNQYGKPAIETWWEGSIEDIAETLQEILIRDFDQRYYTQEEIQEREESKVQEWVKEHIIVGSIPKDNEELKKKGYNVQSLTRPITLSDIPDKVKMFLPKHQQQVIVGSEEHWDIIRNLDNIIHQIPEPYKSAGNQEGNEIEDSIVYLHYFYGNCDWYITERDIWGTQYQMFGYANLGDDQNAEWGYIGVPELEQNGVELDFFWKPCRFGDIGKSLSAVPVEEQVKPLPRIKVSTESALELVPGTIMQVEGKLIKVEQVHIDGTMTVSEPDIKPGRETEIMSSYLEIRNTFAELEKEQQK